METPNREGRHDVGGIRSARPFRIQRLGHFGYLVDDPPASLAFYRDLLGLAQSDRLDFAQDLGVETPAGEHAYGYFLRFGGDHHAFVLFPRWAFAAAKIPKRPGTEPIAHAAWQVGTLREVTDGLAWAKSTGLRLTRPPGRDLPGGNWAFTMGGPDGISQELYYGMDQVGWDGVSRPASMYASSPRHLPEPGTVLAPDLPQSRQAIASGVDLRDGLQDPPGPPPRFDVGGVLLPRPFRLCGHGPIRYFTADIDAATRYYVDTLGFRVTEETRWEGHRAVFLRAGSEHHSVALYPLEMRESLGVRPDSLCLSFGFQVGTYRQLRDAIAFLREHGVTVRTLPAELTAGIERSAFAIDPDGNAVELYWSMDTIGWDGRPRPREARASNDIASWPEVIDGPPGGPTGSTLSGPLG